LRRLWLPPKHPLLDAEIITLEDVASSQSYIQLLIDDAESSTHSYWKAHRLEPKIAMRTESLEAVWGLIASRKWSDDTVRHDVAPMVARGRPD
jgi:hypothetical protein